MCGIGHCNRTTTWVGVVLVILIKLAPISGHEIIEFEVPLLVDLRQNAKLICHYNMKNDHLYSAKWFKEDHEIFRYMPGQKPPGLSFPVEGVRLVRQPLCSPLACDLELTGITPSTAGLYRCEVSSEGPLFRIAQKIANMSVAALPERDPKVVGLASRYSLGDEIRVNCSSDPSMPPAELSWYVNDREVSFLNLRGPWEYEFEGLTSKKLELILPTDYGLYKGNGRDLSLLKLKCISRIPATVTYDEHERQTSVSTILMPPPYLKNEKLAWPGSGSSNIPPFKVLYVYSVVYLVNYLRHFVVL